MKKIAIIILNWNGKEDTTQCLESVGQLSVVGYQLSVYVVDNGSTDGSVKALRTLASVAKNLTFIENKENLGFSEGNNVGIKQALKDGADYVMILNNDTLVDKKLIVQLIDIAERYPQAGILAPKIYFAPGFEFHKRSLADPAKKRYKKEEFGKVIWYAGGLIDWDNVLLSHRGVDEVDKGQYDGVQETDFATGAAMFLKREALKDIGFLDKDYFLYLEDADFCVRAKRAGFKILYVPLAYLWHKVSQSSGIGSELNDYYITRNRLIFGLRYAPLRAKLALLRESINLLLKGRPWQRRGVLDFYFPIHLKWAGNKLVYFGRLGKGSFMA